MPKIGHMMRRLVHPAVLLCGVALLAFFFANVEVQIEGPEGWAAGLPTWRVEDGWVATWVWGGRPVTGYHVWAFSFIALVFHLPFLVHWRFGLKLEARVLACLAFFWVLEDVLWFAVNPAFGLARLTPEHVWWQNHWLLGVPRDYVVFLIGGALAYWYSFWTPGRKAERDTAGAT
jgi:hypothetical protein